MLPTRSTGPYHTLCCICKPCFSLPQLDVFDAAEQYQQAGLPLIVLAGKEYGSGSSRDWAAKGPFLLVSVTCRDPSRQAQESVRCLFCSCFLMDPPSPHSVKGNVEVNWFLRSHFIFWEPWICGGVCGAVGRRVCEVSEITFKCVYVCLFLRGKWHGFHNTQVEDRGCISGHCPRRTVSPGRCSHVP